MLYNHFDLPTDILVSNPEHTGNLKYVYDANGTKLKKTATDNGNITTTEYSGSYIYENGNLKFINHPEGYIEPDGNDYQYVYHLKDIWGNTRITYADSDKNGSITTSEIRREQNFYPFGLEHKGYNNNLRGVKNNLKTYQGQELTEDLGLNTHEWKYRISDRSIGRFWQIDPLAEDYMYNSTYAFAENKLGMGIELEGAEIFTWAQQKLVENAVQSPNGVSAHIVGGAIGLGNSIEGTVEAITNPVQTAKGLGNLAVAAASQGNVSTMMQADAALGTNSLGTADAMVSAVEQGATDLVSGSGVERGAVIGNIAGAVIGSKGTTAAIKGASTLLKTTKTVTKSITAANGVKVTGFTKHGVNQAIERGVKTGNILDAVKNPLKTGNIVTDKLGRQSQRFTGAKAEAAINPQTGKILSVNPTSTKKAARLARQLENQ